jgi:hypothetical protein
VPEYVALGPFDCEEFWLHTPDNVLRISGAADQSRWG